MYVVTVTDLFGCSIQDSIQINQPAAYSISLLGNMGFGEFVIPYSNEFSHTPRAALWSVVVSAPTDINWHQLIPTDVN